MAAVNVTSILHMYIYLYICGECDAHPYKHTGN